MRDNLHAEVLKKPVEEKFYQMIKSEINVQILQKHNRCERILELCLYAKSIGRTMCVAISKMQNRVN